MVAVYRQLVSLCAGERISAAKSTVFLLDEYVGIGPDDPQSFRRFLRERLLEGLPAPPQRIDAPDGLAADPETECERFEGAIRAAGGVDLAVLGLGRNGHVAFNEPGSSLGGPTHVALLAYGTRTDERPRMAMTMGMGTILASRACLLVAFGEAKARAAAEMIEGPVTATWPASALQLHPDATVVLDEAAASGLRNAADYREREALRREREAKRGRAG
jgi:glucosamine-6-phosphate deaminase